MSRLARITLLSLASGGCWAAIAIVLGSPMTRLIWGGVLVSPLIGLAAGFASVLFPSAGRIRRAAFSLISLYLAATLFGLGMGVYDVRTGQNSARIRTAVVTQAVMGTLWGLTFTGYVIVLWPLAYANHTLLSRAWKERKSGSDTVAV